MSSPSEATLQVLRRLRARRISLKLSVIDLAKAVGLTAGQIYKLEAGRHPLTVEQLLRLSKALFLPPQSFFSPMDEASEEVLATYFAMPSNYQSLLLEHMKRIATELGES